MDQKKTGPKIKANRWSRKKKAGAKTGTTNNNKYL